MVERTSEHSGPEELWMRGPVGTEHQRNSENKGPVGSEDQRNSGPRGQEEQWAKRTRGPEDQRSSQ